MKILVTFDDGKTKVFDNIDQIDHIYFRNELDFTNHKIEDPETVSLYRVLKVEVFA